MRSRQPAFSTSWSSAPVTRFVSVAETTTESLLYAGKLDLSDFEDALQVAAAVACQAGAIATRNLRDYARSPIQAMEPKDLLKVLLGSES